MEDHFSSIRFLLISAVIVMVGVIIVSTVGMAIQEEVKGMQKPTLLFLLLFTAGKLFLSPSFWASSGLSSASCWDLMRSTGKGSPGP